jgi:hypothetical protein
LFWSDEPPYICTTGADAHAALVRVVDDRLRVLREGVERHRRHERPLQAVLARLHEPVDELLRVGEVRVARLLERGEPLDRVERVRLQADVRERGRARDRDRLRHAHAAEAREHLLLRVEEARAELLEQRVGAVREA